MFGQCPWCGGSVGYGTSFLSIALTLLFGLLIVVGVILLIIWAARRPSGTSSGQSSTSDPALDAARRRFANGEITKEQLDDIQRTLSGY